MAKYSVNGTEIIDDSGKIDWNKLKNNPSAANVSGVFLGTLTNCGTDCFFTVQRTSNTTNGVVTFVINMNKLANCNCNCDCSVNCNC